MAKHLDVHEVSPWTRVSNTVPTLIQIEASKCSEPGLKTAGGCGIPDGRPPLMLVDARFILFIPVELLLGGFLAGFMPQRRQLSCTAERDDLRRTPLEAQTQPWHRRAIPISPNTRQTVMLTRAADAQARPYSEPAPRQ